VTDAEGYIWQLGGALAAECLATGKELLVIIIAARESQKTGQRIAMKSTFKWPIIT
jgi:hypothetical protein